MNKRGITWLETDIQILKKKVICFDGSQVEVKSLIYYRVGY